METALKTLPESVETLKKLLLSERELSVQKNAELKKKDAEIIQLKQQYQHMLEQFRLAQKKQFGKSSEISADQLPLFNEAEQIVEEEASQSSAEADAPIPTRQKPKRKPLPKDLPRETVLHDLAEEDKVCDCCGGPLHQMGCDTSEQLEFIPATIKVIEHVRPKYSCRSCEKQGTQVGIKMAPVAASPIPKSMATASLLSQIITSKYQYALPLYRQESLFKQYGIDLNRKTMASWMLQINPLLQNLYERMHALQLQQGVIHADETPLKVIHEDKNTCYMWVYCTGTDSPGSDNHKPPNMVLYDYQNSRAGRCAQDYLRQFKGYLQVDGYVGYEKAEATLVGCWAHARRKFIEAQTAQVKGKTGKADWAINHIQKLYRIETAIKDKAPEEKQAIRQQQSHPLLVQFKVWLDKSALQVPPRSAIGKAIAYSLKQWPKLNRYIENGNLSIDNNRAERAIKPFVIGRKNWLFANTAKGAQASAVLYSIIETAKANGLIPFDYLKYLLEELPGNPDDIDYLLPWNVALAEK